MATESDIRFMRRALQLAACGRGEVSPNPMVGAVIVRDGVIIGEGFHRRYGGPHAEVNAVNSVADRSLLAGSTIYVTLEPCAHFGKTPPCADLIVGCGFGRVVVGCRDPFAKVAGRGIERIRQAGIDVTVGVLERECLEINRRFVTAHSEQRPYVMLKWACSADGYTAVASEGSVAPYTFSTPATSALVHRLRSEYDAIMVGSGTVLTDDPRLDVRLVEGRIPVRVVVDRRRRLTGSERVFASGGTVVFTSGKEGYPADVDLIVDDGGGLRTLLSELYSRGITSVMVEGGATLGAAFLDAGLWDEVRIERSATTLGSRGALKRDWPHIAPRTVESFDGNIVFTFFNPEFGQTADIPTE